MFNFNINSNKNKKLHFIGIGGVSMSALAEYLLNQGYKISGSDSKKSQITEKLKNLGAEIYYEHSGENLKDAEIVIYTDAISMDNEELKTAIKRKLDLVDRAEFLGYIMKNFEFSIAVSGTHGKTSTTSMITEVVYDDKSNPTIMLGGHLDKINGNIKIGENKLFLTEACEYKGNIKKYFPSLAIILNIDEDHLDYFDNIDHIISTFEDYAENLGESDYILINSDDENSNTLKNHTKAKVFTFGIDKVSDYSAKNVTFVNGGFPKFDVFFKHKKLAEISLSVMGKHNVYNALAAFAACHIYEVNPEKIADKISKYTGVHRRLEYKGSYNGIDVLDDYAHHPTEIKSTLSAIRNKYANDIYCIFQPHTFTRTKLLLNSFAESFDDADKIIIPDIYAAREKDYGDIHSRMLVDAIIKNGKKAIYLGSFDEVKKHLVQNAKPGDCIVTMGAGDVFEIGEEILNEQKEKQVPVFDTISSSSETIAAY
ncbi:MAG: UDP-N-acetylmuramate--L-alanine ligase [Tissierellia bacterium]|nr:UDP-N-acetylmuramate--L-alanine ligase [Tissierellia bacterium]